jgi:ATP phosphoribosyltransferase regulatory subunit
VIHPLPPGTRDVLPEEMAELRALADGLRRRFLEAGYGEVHTPLLEYEDVLRRGDERGASQPGYRLFDEHGQVLALRSDMTVPIARLVATRYGEVPGCIRLSYFMHAYRALRAGAGQPREFLQGGLELVGAPAPDGEAEVIGLTLAALEDSGLGRHRIGLGDGSLYRTLLDAVEVREDARMGLLDRLGRRDLVGLEARVDALGLSPAARRLLVTVPAVRGGAEVLERAEGPIGPALDNLRECMELLAERGAADRVIVDLGLVRDLSYYTGAVFEVYDPAVGFPLGGGGRYDDMIGRFGTPRPAVGVGLDLQRVHAAQAAEDRLA